LLEKEVCDSGIHPRLVHGIIDVSKNIIILPTRRDVGKDAIPIASFGLWLGHDSESN